MEGNYSTGVTSPSVTPRKILLATFGSHGDVHPFVGLGQSLRDRGHDVTLHTSEYFRPLVESLGGGGLGFSGYGTVEDFKRGISNKMLWSRTRGYKAVFGIGVKEGLRKSYEELARVIGTWTEAERASAVIVNSTLSMSARVAQEKFGIAGATVHLSPVIMRSCDVPPKMPGLFMPTWMPLWLKKKIWEVGDTRFIDPLICPTLNPLRAELGLAPVSRVLDRWWNSPQRVIGLWPEWYGPSAADWPEQFRHTGFPMYDEGDVTPLPASLEKFLSEGEAPIAFTPGSAMLFGHRFFEAAARACRDLGRRGLLLTRHAEQIPKDLPAGVIHVPYAPFGALLPRCAAAVHHGGIGTTSQALKAGIPQVVVHFSHDQPDNASRLERLGVGEGINSMFLGGRRLARTLGRLLSDPSVARACKATAARVTPGLNAACELIEALPAGAPEPVAA